MTKPSLPPVRVALVTGASSGIGLEVGRRLLHEGYFVIFTARLTSLSRFQKLAWLKESSCHWLRALDVTESRDRHTLLEEIRVKFGRLDVLINNAGIIYRAPLEYAYEFEAREQMQVNFHAPFELIKICLPLMRETGRGHIINISSAAGFFCCADHGSLRRLKACA